MSPASPRPCPHDLRPGTTVCLRCRRDAYAEARTRVLRHATRAGGVVVVIAAVAGAVLLGTRRSAAHALPGVHEVALQSDTALVSAPAVHPAPRPPASARQSLPAAAPTMAAPVPAAPRLDVVPAIPQGRRDLGNGIFAERIGDTVIVHFDTPMTRTRRRDKFEHTVRVTLPVVYGAVGDSLLAGVPAGQLLAGGDLLGELPTRGIRLTMGGRTGVTLWPGTRAGHDGPLVMSYRVVTSR